MSTETHKAQQGREGEDTLADRDMVLELNFVPSWARQSADAVRYDLRRETPRERRGDRPGRGRSSGPPRRDPGRPSRRDAGGGARRAPPAERPRRRDLRERPHPEHTNLPLRIRFLPEQSPLAQVVRKLKSSRRFYPLMEVTSLFLAQPDSCFVRVEVEDGGGGMHLYQCRVCGMTALDRERVTAHMLKDHFEEAFEIEETTCEAPTGTFVCLARCGLSGELIGPPNHNSYKERLRELHLLRYANMPLAEYESHVETVRDADLIEKWRQASTRQRVYRPKDRKGAGESLSAVAAKALYTGEIAPRLINQTRAVSLPSKVARRTEDPVLMRLLSEGWQHENRFPGSLLFALRGAFRHRGLHLFRVGQGGVFVGSTEPSPLDCGHVVEPIREVLEYLRAHPGGTRQQLLEALRPGTAEDSAEALQVLSPLSWLIEKGHIIEFFDGTLAVPMGGAQRESAAAAGEPRRDKDGA